VSYKNKCAEFGIHILSLLSLLTIISLVFVLISINYNFVSIGLLNQWLKIINLAGIIIPFLTFITGLISLFYKPKKLAIFLVLASLIMSITNFWKIAIMVTS